MQNSFEWQSRGACLSTIQTPEKGSNSLHMPGFTSRQVILMCEFGRRVLGVVISKEVARPPIFPPLPKTRFFVGGPVCGGRFGVVQYVVMVLSTSRHCEELQRVVLAAGAASLPQTAATDEAHEVATHASSITAQTATQSARQGHGAHDCGDAEGGLALGSAANEAPAGRRAVCLRAREEWKMEQDGDVVPLVRRLAADPQALQVLVFKGYCAWGESQLQVLAYLPVPQRVGFCIDSDMRRLDRTRGCC
jgi:putative AlgH/UPF0301 family transcriptional regulator